MNLEGTKVLVLGSFGELSNSDAVEALRSRGAVIADDVAMDVEVVFAGEDPGAAVDSARELGVRIADAAALTAALKGDSPSRAIAPEPEPAPALDDDDQTTEGFGKGDRVRIVGGREGVGEFGEIFWWGESKFGDGMRAGVTADSGTKYWVDEEHLARPDDAVDESALAEAKAASRFGRGDRIRVISGKNEGAVGTIFWWGESKWGDGMRAGVETDGGEKIWVDDKELAADEEEGEDGSDIPF